MPRFTALLLFASLLALPVSAEELSLPRVGTIGDAPASERTVVVTVEQDGTIRVGERELSYPELRRVLRDAGAMHRGKGRVSGANALLRIDRRAPWIATQWVLIACAQGRIARVFYGVLPESGDAEGAIAWFLPTDKGLPLRDAEPEEVLGLVVRIDFSGTGVEPAALYPLLMETFEEERKQAILDLRAMSNVPHGFALGVADVAMRAGISNIEIYGTAIPPEDADLKALVKKHAPPTGTPSISVDDVALTPVKVKLPAVARVRGKFAGHVPVAVEEQETSELKEEGIEEEEMEPEEEEIEEDESIEDDHPFTGPSSNDPIGVGRGKRKVARNLKAPPAPKVNNAVERGIVWLATAQDPKTGGWPSPEAKHDVATTGLAILAILGAGYTDRGSAEENPFSGNVRLGLLYLMTHQKDDGRFATRDKAIYDSAIAALALTEAYWMTRNPRYKKPAQVALNFLAAARNPHGAWGDGVRDGKSNTAATVWCVFALMAGKFANLDVDPDAVEGAKQWIDQVTDENTGRAGYDKKGGGVFRPKELADKFPADKSRAMTAAAVMARILLGEDPRESEIIRKGAAECVKRLPQWNTQDGSIDMTYWCFGTNAMFRVGGASWRTWSSTMKANFVDSQNKPGTPEAGSWDPVGAWGAIGGRVYSTALMTICMEVYYRYNRPFVFGAR